MTRTQARASGLVAFVVVTLGVVTLGAGGRAQAGALERVRAAGVLRWGADVQGGEPYAFDSRSEPGKIVGFEADIADALARSLGVARAEMVQNDWSTLVPALERGGFDVAMNGLEAKPALAGRILLSRPYFLFTERLLARKDDARLTPERAALRGQRIGTLSSSAAVDLILAAGGVPVRYEGVEEPYIDLVNGRTDGVLLDDVIARRYGEPRADLRVVGDLAEGTYVVGLRRGDEDLRDAIDAALARMARDGELRAIFARWGIDSERQARLATWTPPAVPAAATSAPTEDVAPPAGLFSGRELTLFFEGAALTLGISVGAMALAMPLGLLLALLRLYAPRPVGLACAAYVEVMRGTPALLQLFVLYYGLAGVVTLSPVAAAVLGLGLNYAAYESEVYRGGLAAVPRGQLEAAFALGMDTPMAVRRIVMPQAFRFALPGVTNDFIALLKDSSLVSVISVVELTKRMSIIAVDRRDWVLPGVMCALLYLAMSVPLSRLARRLEARLAPGARA